MHSVQTPSVRRLLLDAIKRRPAERIDLALAGTGCVRKSYYLATERLPKDDAEPAFLELVIERALDSISRQDQGEFHVISHLPVEVTLGSTRARGTADLVFVGSEGAVLVANVFVVDDATWAAVTDGPLCEHRARTNLSAHAIDAPRWSVCYVRATSGELREHTGDTDAAGAGADFAVIGDAAYWVRRGTPPSRPFESPELACERCPFRAPCWGAENDDRIH